MPELRDIIEGNRIKEMSFSGLRLKPTASADVPERTVFLNSDSPNIRLCFKDGDGNIFKFPLRPL